jgi:cytochrome c-type biogenesis protein CcmH
MKRHLGWIAIACMLAISVVALAAYGGGGGRTTLAARAHTIAAELRCPACQGETVAESQTQIARAIRTLIMQRLAKGQSADQIESYLVSRFGDHILMAPPRSGADLLAWLAPPLLLAGGLGLLLVLVAEWRRRAEAGPPAARREYLERVRAEIREQ